MACLKSLTSSANQPYRKARSYSEYDVSSYQMKQMNCNCVSGKPYSSPFISYQSKLDTVPLLPFLKPTKSSRDLIGCESCHQDIDVDNLLQNLKNCVNRMHANILPVSKDSNFFPSGLAVNEMPSCTQQGLLDKTTTCKPVIPPVLENNSNLANATISSRCNSTVLKATMQSSNTETPAAQSSIGDSNITCCSGSNITDEGNKSTGMSSHCQCFSDLSNKCCLHESKCSSSNTQNYKKVMQSKPVGSNNGTQSALKPILNLTSVLSAPRKTVKKGRPSSKKQKKRQREKQKHGLQPLQAKETLGSTHIECDTEQKLHSQSTELVFNQNNKKDISSDSACNQKFETAHEVLKQKCPLTQLFVRLMSGSEDESSVEDNDDQCKNDGSVSKHKKVPFPPIKGFGFGCALDLDTIFKKTIPQGLINAEKTKDYAFHKNNGFQKNTCQSLSQPDCFNKRNTASTSPVLKDSDSCFFTSALSLDILFCKKPTSSSQVAVDQKESTFYSPTDDSIDHLPNGNEADSETLNKINASWNESYPTAGFRSCASVSTDEIKHPTIKVHFAAEPDFLTVHFVSAEERNGNWHHVIREREQFEKRIQELQQILSPFLEVSHRAKVLEQRNDQEQK